MLRLLRQRERARLPRGAGAPRADDRRHRGGRGAHRGARHHQRQRAVQLPRLARACGGQGGAAGGARHGRGRVRRERRRRPWPRIRDVEHAFGLVRGWLAATDDSGDTLQLFGVDLTTDAIDSYDVRAVGRDGIDELELLNDPTSVLLTEEYAARRGIAVDDRVRVRDADRASSALRVRGLLAAEGLATVFGGQPRGDGPAGGAAAARQGAAASIRSTCCLRRRRGRRAPCAIGSPARCRRRCRCIRPGAARRAVRARHRGVPGDARRPEPALPAGRRLHRLQHERRPR